MAFISKAKCPLITSKIPIICALQQVWVLGNQASSRQNANVDAGIVCFYKPMCVSLLFKQAKAIRMSTSQECGTYLKHSTCISICILHRAAPELLEMVFG